MKLLALTFFVMFCITGRLMADTVVLKNGESIKGIIEEEVEGRVVLNVGGGTITLSETDIESVERSDKKTNRHILEEWREKYFESFPAPTPEDQELLDAFSSLKNRKMMLERKVSEKEAIRAEIRSIRNGISRLRNKQEAVGTELKSVDPKRAALKYNSLMIEFNLASSRVAEAVNRLNALQEERDKIDLDAIEFLRGIKGFSEFFEKRKKEIAADADMERMEFFASLKRKLSELQEHIREDETSFVKRKDGIIVAATVNGRDVLNFLLDTGATLTVISRDTASRLGIDLTGANRDVNLTVANGNQTRGKFVILSSVKLGSAEARGVEAAVADIDLSPGVDGLLGMSFLSRFIFSIDTKNQKLIFTSFEQPKAVYSEK